MNTISVKQSYVPDDEFGEHQPRARFTLDTTDDQIKKFMKAFYPHLVYPDDYGIEIIQIPIPVVIEASAIEALIEANGNYAKYREAVKKLQEYRVL